MVALWREKESKRSAASGAKARRKLGKTQDAEGKTSRRLALTRGLADSLPNRKLPERSPLRTTLTIIARETLKGVQRSANLASRSDAVVRQTGETSFSGSCKRRPMASRSPE